MSRCVAFRTPGLIPLEAFTTFGVNVKPMTTSPFGYFGTGLKYAIAVLLRHGCSIVMWRGLDKYIFYLRREDFRGKEFQFVRMKHEKWSILTPKYRLLPFTTELGKNWELWQAFRELETNTRDEKGKTSLVEWDADYRSQLQDETIICVYGDRFVDEFLDMDKHFLREGKTVREDEAIQVIDRPSRHVYYRGVRVMDLKEEAEFTYNILAHVDLTEDRTVKYSFLVDSLIAEHIAKSEDEDFVGRAVTGNRWESRMGGYAYATVTPSRTFSDFAPRATNPQIREFIKKTDPSVPTTTTIHLVIPKPEVTENELMDICRVVSETLSIGHFVAKNVMTGAEIEYGEPVDD